MKISWKDRIPRSTVKTLLVVALFFILSSFFQILIFPFLVDFQEKNSFLYERLSYMDESLYTDAEHSKKNAPIVFLGDSQILSGVHPKELGSILSRPIWFLPRPSEQPEGMLLRYKEYEKKIGIKPALVVVNGSVFSLSEMDVASAHRSLVLNYDSFHLALFFNSTLRNFYLKNLSSGLFYIFGRVFPFLRLNASMSTSVKIIGEGDEFSYSEKKMESLISGNPFRKWAANRKRNQFLNLEYSKNKGYMDWARYETYDGVCVPNSQLQPLPPNAELALQKTRSSSLEAWKVLFRYLKSRGVAILAIALPFRPDFDSRLNSLPQMSQWESILIEEEVPYWKLGGPYFAKEDFGDYTHFNTCGMKKLLPPLAEGISKNLRASAF
ncbi:hypothetical protein A0128_13535 [Leptospira tipperaryensis]|uniref:DUF1574 domain-containing protein n=1 Tax=Leptospira tipperaryensis TaxID=2564040 RepID=A0A1D7UYX2_9LEPT|nr:hypothetical protein [Leptospira tipperaryensis]AOP34780.1 hypothetical protein A0128_13535 [Leptospira tipperaryensis]